MSVTTIDRLTPEEHRILAEGRAALHELTNVFPGTPGGVVMDLVRRGLMAERRCPPGRDLYERTTTYELTGAGYEALKSYQPPYVPITETNHADA